MARSPQPPRSAATGPQPPRSAATGPQPTVTISAAAPLRNGATLLTLLRVAAVAARHPIGHTRLAIRTPPGVFMVQFQKVGKGLLLLFSQPGLLAAGPGPRGDGRPGGGNGSHPMPE